MKMRYLALLRGINVGGHKKIKMADLRQMTEALGYTNAKTALASGNLAFDSDTDDMTTIREKIMSTIEITFGFQVPTQIIPQSQITALVTHDPFANIDVTKATRLYVTFLPEPTQPSIEIPYHHPDGDFRILSVSDSEVCSVLTVTKTRSVDAMKILEEQFGKFITTRNWNTVLKLATL